MRVIAGRLGGRRLRAPRGDGTRPTSDRVRESLFATLGDLDGARVLDLFAGSGALGIEALSRGAREAVFVERAAGAIAALRANLAALELEPVGRVLARDAHATLPRLARAGEVFDLIFLDPPYAGDAAARALAAIADHPLLAPAGEVVVESDVRSPPEAPQGLSQRHGRRYGDTLVTRWVRGDADAPSGGATRP